MNCGNDVPGKILEHLLTNLKENPITSLQPKASFETTKSNGFIRSFSQHEFIDAGLLTDHGLDAYGYIYYPK